LRLREKREKELEKRRDEDFNSYRPMVPHGKEWRVKTTLQAKAVKPPEGAVRPGDQAVKPGSPEMPPGFASSIPMVCDEKVSSVHTLEDDEHFVDYSSSPERMNLEINVVHLICLLTVRCLRRRTWLILTLGQQMLYFRIPKTLIII
jgi:hypothetical protein